MDKALLRRESLRRVKALDPAERARRSREIRARLEELPAFREAASVFAYLALPSEPDLAELAELAVRHGEKAWAVPRVDQETGLLSFHPLPGPEGLIRGAHGILEPAPSADPPAERPGIVLVPGVAFDPESGARLGRGMGYYDRFLGPLAADPDPPLLVGVCFQEQLVPLEPEAHDVPVDLVVSA